jgi:hypothetical protein
MEMLTRVEQSPSLRDLPPVELCRMTNAAARMFEVYQSACLTLLKLKSRGCQRVVVQHQHVSVGAGGQAVVAARVEGCAGGRK